MTSWKKIHTLSLANMKKLSRKAKKMKNSDILKALQHRRKVAQFAKHINLSRQATLTLLKDNRPHKSQYYNYILFIRLLFEAWITSRPPEKAAFYLLSRQYRNTWKKHAYDIQINSLIIVYKKTFHNYNIRLTYHKFPKMTKIIIIYSH